MFDDHQWTPDGDDDEGDKMFDIFKDDNWDISVSNVDCPSKEIIEVVVEGLGENFTLNIELIEVILSNQSIHNTLMKMGCIKSYLPYLFD